MSKEKFEKKDEFGIKLREDEFEEDNFEEDDADTYLTSAQREKILGGSKKKGRRKHSISGHLFGDVGRD